MAKEGNNNGTLELTERGVQMSKLGFMGALLTSLILLSACEGSGHFLFNDPPDDISQASDQTRYTVFFESSPMPLAMYEPAQGSFAGMYTDALPSPNGRVIAPVEASIGASHATFMEVMHLGEDFPTLWVLECIAEQKIPVIVILPPEEGNPFDNEWEEILTETAISFSEFPVPMFAVFYPVPVDPIWDSATYIAFFRYARALFAVHAPHVAFVWAVDGDKENFIDYFPGDLAADWVGLSLFSRSTDVLESGDALERIISFYHTFQQRKPMMLNLGLGHFSTADHRYHIAETSDALGKVYRTILRDFPRVKMVNYMDINRIDYNGNDYRVSMDTALRTAYRDSIQGFISATPRNFDDGLITQPIRSAYTAFVEDGRIYLDIRILEEALDISVSEQTRWIDGARRVDTELLGIRAEIYQGHVWLR